jgi:peptidyl-prolyl cis-trans isomerase A (cyclophilin A)
MVTLRETAMRTLTLLLAIAAAARGENVQIKVHPDLELPEMLQLLHAATGTAYLYPPGDLRGKTAGASYDFVVPRERLGDAADFLIRQCGLTLRDCPPVKVILPASALESRFRAPGLDTEIEFDRGPGGWRGEAEAVGSLSGKTVEALLAEALKDKPMALDLVAAAAPRTPSVAAAVAGMLSRPGLKSRAGAALRRFGFDAKPALPAMRDAAQADPTLGDLVGEIEAARHPALLEPTLATDTAPSRYLVRFETTAGEFDVEVLRDWAPLAADRFWNLVRIGYFDGCRFFRVVPGFVAQFGKSGDPAVNRRWWNATFKDEPVKEANKRGYLSFAKGGKDSRATQVFLNLKDNRDLDGQGFAAFGRVTKGMEVVDALHSGYGEEPDQGQLHFKGEGYLRENFPKLDTIKAARVVE